jgi:hypothetical protein
LEISAGDKGRHLEAISASFYYWTMAVAAASAPDEKPGNWLRGTTATKLIV